uniref:Odorant-binding protein 29 n=1 Tax=Encarsia formosa TaxID=32400 RepID=A0A514TTY2_ENCFO|nr:odorant-binding protein 29 [Encarsia formosa]
MKAFVTFFALCLAAVHAAGLTDDQKAKLADYKKSCFVETGADPNAFENYKANIVKGVEVKFDDKMNCFAACMLKKIGIMRPDGTIDEAVARSKVPKELPQDKVDQAINTCKTQVGKDNCEIGGKVTGCLVKTKVLEMILA